MRILMIATSVLGLTSVSQAQDASWDRWFVGFDAGYISRESFSTVDGRFEYEGFAATLSAGKWWNLGTVALGFDAGASFGGPTSSLLDTFPDGYWSMHSGDVFSTSLRVKAGVPMGNVLPYAAIGPQYSHTKTTVEDRGPGYAYDYSRWTTTAGLLASVGTEVLISQNVSLKAEAGANLSFRDFGTTPTEHSGYSIKIGGNYYFD